MQAPRRSAWDCAACPNEAESSVVERDIALARETGAKLHVAHISTREALQAVRRRKKTVCASPPRSRRIT